MEITDDLVRKITDELWRHLAPQALAAPITPGPPAALPPRGRRRILTEADVRAACPVAGGPGQILSLAPGDILTPLAQDYVQSLKIILEGGAV